MRAANDELGRMLRLEQRVDELECLVDLLDREAEISERYLLFVDRRFATFLFALGTVMQSLWGRAVLHGDNRPGWAFQALYPDSDPISGARYSQGPAVRPRAPMRRARLYGSLADLRSAARKAGIKNTSGLPRFNLVGRLAEAEALPERLSALRGLDGRRSGP